jgi:hypothetical protein
MTDQHHVGSFLANGSALRPEFRPYRWREPSSPYRARTAAAIRAEIGDEEDSWDIPASWDEPQPEPGERLKPCGTNAAYQRHLYYGQDPCDACMQAHLAKNRERQRARYVRRDGETPRSRDAIAERLAKLAGMKLHTGFGNTPPPGYITAAEAAQRLGVHVRTVTRYIERLREAS